MAYNDNQYWQYPPYGFADAPWSHGALGADEQDTIIFSTAGKGPKGDTGEAAYFDDLTDVQLTKIYQQASAVANESEDAVVTTTATTTTIAIPFNDYDSSFDILFVDVNGLDLAENVDYTISGSSIILTTELPSGQDVHFRRLSYTTIDGDKTIVNEMGRKDYNTVAEMVADESLEAGDICHTLGFQSVGDDGAAWYVVKAHGVADGVNIIALENGLFAELQITESSNVVEKTAGFTRVFAELYAEFPFMIPDDQASGVHGMQGATMDADNFYIFGVDRDDAAQHLYVLSRSSAGHWNFSSPPYTEYTYSGLGHCNGVCCDGDYIYIGGYSSDPDQSQNCFHRIRIGDYEYVDSITTESKCSSLTMYGDNDEYLADCEGGYFHIYDKTTGETVKKIQLKTHFTRIGTKTLAKQGMSYDKYTKTFRICTSVFDQILVYQDDGTFISTLDLNLHGESSFELEDAYDENGEHYLFLYQHNIGYLNYLCVVYNDAYINNFERTVTATAYEANTISYVHDLRATIRPITTWAGMNFFIQNSIYERIRIRPAGNYTSLQGSLGTCGIPQLRFSRSVELYFDYPNISSITNYPCYRVSSACRNLRVYAPTINIVLPSDCYNMQIEASKIVTEADTNTVTLHECILCAADNTEATGAYLNYWHIIPNFVLNSSIINSVFTGTIDESSLLISANCIAN